MAPTYVASKQIHHTTTSQSVGFHYFLMRRFYWTFLSVWTSFIPVDWPIFLNHYYFFCLFLFFLLQIYPGEWDVERDSVLHEVSVQNNLDIFEKFSFCWTGSSNNVLISCVMHSRHLQHSPQDPVQVLSYKNISKF